MRAVRRGGARGGAVPVVLSRGSDLQSRAWERLQGARARAPSIACLQRRAREHDAASRHHGRDPGDGRRRRRRAGRLDGRRWPSTPATTRRATSVPGVAQRTGATIYYLEMFPGDRRARAGAGAGADAGARRSRYRDRQRTDGGRTRDPARAGDARPDDADRLHAPRLLDDREDRAGRWPSR